jgi:hypothetical protein
MTVNVQRETQVPFILSFGDRHETANDVAIGFGSSFARGGWDRSRRSSGTRYGVLAGHGRLATAREGGEGVSRRVPLG